MKVQELLSLVPDRLLEELAVETKVDHYAKKLQGAVVFKLLLHCLLTHKDNSLRSVRSVYESLLFQVVSPGGQGGSVAVSSISERLSTIEVNYFEKLYQSCVRLFKRQLGKGAEEWVCIDSTIVALSTKLLFIGYHLKGGDAEAYRQLKFTMAYSNGVAEVVNFYTDQAHNSENLALRETMLEQAEQDKATIKVFDKGVTARATYDALTEKGIVFVSVINPHAKHDKVQVQTPPDSLPLPTDTLLILSDEWCQFYGEGKKKARYLVRRIETIRQRDAEAITFITNTEDLSAEEVTELYKKRWQVEVFFRFIKGVLNFSHLLNRTENGIKVMLYTTLIAAVLLEAYKRANHMSGYKIAMQQFAQALEEELIKELIRLCGGDPNLLQKVLYLDSS